MTNDKLLSVEIEVVNSGENWSFLTRMNNEYWTSRQCFWHRRHWVLGVGTGNCPFDHLVIDVTVPCLLERLDETFFTRGFI